MKSKPNKCVFEVTNDRSRGGMHFLATLVRVAVGVIIILSSMLVAVWLLNGCARVEAGSSEQTTIRLTLIRSGGVAGITSRISINSVDLAPEKVGKLEQLLDKSEFFRLPEKIGSPQPDHFQYRLEIEANGRRHSVTATGGTMPDGLRELIQWIHAEGSAKRDRSPRAS
ncbi:MAG: protealysin inhibitor emfourin [Syntrophobacter sp.]